jgi:prokaryotic ubiquitin-like protein Pup
MAEQEQKRKSPSTSDRTSTEAEVDVAEQTPATSERGEKIKAELDDLLDEIDEVLEDNAEEFVRNYVQKGGQ